MSLSEAEMNTLLVDVGVIKADNKKILDQVTQTNGRVTELEQWKNKAIGALIAVSIISGTGLIAFIIEVFRGKQ